MKPIFNLKTIFSNFADEILLYSGQYALFYIIMNFSKENINYFADVGHTILLFVLILQTFFLVIFGKKPIYRFLGSLIVPLVYTIVEYSGDTRFMADIAHLFFWIFSIVTGSLQAYSLYTKNNSLRKQIEFSITILNVVIFLFIYYYFDLLLSLDEKLRMGIISAADYHKHTEIFMLPDSLSLFVSDGAHVYLIIGGVLLSLSLALGRVKILTLKDKINELFGRYVDENIRDIIIKDHGKSEKKELTILFSDIRSFTSISENYTATQITQMLNIYFKEWSETAKKHNGIVDKYIGDAVMIVFGINSFETQYNDSINCALEMLNNLPQIKSKLKSLNLPCFENIGIGINSGEVIIGNIGGGDRLNYTVIGDNVNLASRLESLCKTFHTALIVSEPLYNKTTSILQSCFEIHSNAEIRGKNEKINIYLYNAK